jgi:maleylpyruvate isomerase
VLTHVARNADGAVNLLTWARTGIETPQYRSSEQRALDIEAGAARGAAEHLDDLAAACDRLREAVAAMPPQAWATVVRWTHGSEAPAASVMWSRLREVEVHHVDPAAGSIYRGRRLRAAGDRRAGFRPRPTGNACAGRQSSARPPIGEGVTAPVVTGPVGLVVAWLVGRSSGDRLVVEPPGSLPEVPPLG